jgi:hypothetical protein
VKYFHTYKFLLGLARVGKRKRHETTAGTQNKKGKVIFVMENFERKGKYMMNHRSQAAKFSLFSDL